MDLFDLDSLRIWKILETWFVVFPFTEGPSQPYPTPIKGEKKKKTCTFILLNIGQAANSILTYLIEDVTKKNLKKFFLFSIINKYAIFFLI